MPYDSLELVFDRTASDVSRASYLAGLAWTGMTDDERMEYISGLKGAYNATDLDRVEQAVDFINGLLHSYGYKLDMVIKTDWTIQDVPQESDMTRYLGNIHKIRDDYAPYITTLTLPSEMGNLDFAGANSIEEFLSVVYFFIRQMTGAYITCGEVCSGEV